LTCVAVTMLQGFLFFHDGFACQLAVSCAFFSMYSRES
jgi:hypothetical protein